MHLILGKEAVDNLDVGTEVALKKSADILPDAGSAFLNNSGFWELIPMQNGRFCRKAPVRMRITADQSDLFRNRKLGRLGLIAEPLGVDLGIFAVGDDLL